MTSLIILAGIFILIALVVRSIARMRREADGRVPGPQNNWRRIIASDSRGGHDSVYPGSYDSNVDGSD